MISREQFISKTLWKREYQEVCYDANSNNTSSNITSCNSTVWTPTPGLNPDQNTLQHSFSLTDCTDQSKIKLSSVAFFAGFTLGNIFSGISCDRIGRKNTHLWGAVCLTLSMFLISFSQNLYQYGMVQFFVGFMHTSDFATSCVHFHELLSPKRVHFSSTFSSCGFGGGFGLLAILAYFIPDWRHLAFVIAMFQVVLLPVIFWLPESPKWLRQNGRNKEAEEIEGFILGWGRRESTNIFQSENGVSEKNARKISKTESDSSSFLDSASSKIDCKKYTILDLFRDKIIRTRTLMMLIVWPVISTLYYCFNFNTSRMEGNIYLNCLTQSGIEIIMYIISGEIAARYGRRSMLIASFSVSGISCFAALISVVLNLDIPTDVFGWIGKIGICAAFNQIFIQTPELFPTNLRGIGMGFPNSFARIFSGFAPYFQDLKEYSLGLFWFSQLAAVSAAIAAELMLPETAGEEVPANMDDIRKQEKRRIFKINL